MKHTIQLILEVESDETDWRKVRDGLILSLNEGATRTTWGWVDDLEGDPNEAIPIVVVKVSHADDDLVD
jgi:hypothetical protein